MTRTGNSAEALDDLALPSPQSGRYGFEGNQAERWAKGNWGAVCWRAWHGFCHLKIYNLTRRHVYGWVDSEIKNTEELYPTLWLPGRLSEIKGSERLA